MTVEGLRGYRLTAGTGFLFCRLTESENSYSLLVVSLFKYNAVFVHGGDFCEGFDAESAVAEDTAAALVCLFDAGTDNSL